jgi:hypothetical protein
MSVNKNMCLVKSCRSSFNISDKLDDHLKDLEWNADVSSEEISPCCNGILENTSEERKTTPGIEH